VVGFKGSYQGLRFKKWSRFYTLAPPTAKALSSSRVYRVSVVRFIYLSALTVRFPHFRTLCEGFEDRSDEAMMD
jgi:hypothetical protein